MNIVASIQKLEKEKVIKILIKVYLCAFSFFLITFAFLGRLSYDEIDSYALPVISMQYRGSLTINQSDIDTARQDFPELYMNVYSYEDLRSAKLVKSSDDPNTWLSFYFPLYGMAVLPLKLILQLLGLPQIRAFPVTNALSVICALILTVKVLKVPNTKKLFLLLIVTTCPIFLYCLYIGNETLMFSMVLSMLVLYHEKHYCLAAIVVALASWMNPTVLLFGFPMIAGFFINMFKSQEGGSPWKTIYANLFNIIKYGACYIGFVIPFVFNLIYSGSTNSTFAAGSFSGLPDRFCAYFFDLNFGFASFALIILLAAIIMLPILMYKKIFECLYYYSGLVLVVLGFSININIDSGMTMCARYVIWTYPILAFIAAVYLSETIKKAVFRDICCGVTYVSMMVCLIFNSRYNNAFYGNPYLFNSNIATIIFDNFPELYNPLPSTFFSRVLHMDMGYDYNSAIYCDSSDGSNGLIRKIIILGTAENKNALKEKLVCIAGDKSQLYEMIDRIPEDNKHHYLNFNRFSSLQLRKATIEEMGLVKEGNVFCEYKDLNVGMSGEDSLGAYTFPVPLASNTFYKISFSFDKESLEDNEVSISYVDLWAPGYDAPNQEEKIKINSESYEFVSYINSGTVPDEPTEKYVRVIVVSEKPIILTDFSVVEMCEPG